MAPGVNSVVYGYSSWRTTPGVSLYRSCLTLEENVVAVITQNRVIDHNLKRQKLKTKLFVVVDYSY